MTIHQVGHVEQCGAPKRRPFSSLTFDPIYGEDLLSANSARSSVRLPEKSKTPDSTRLIMSQAPAPRAVAKVVRRPSSPNWL